MIQQAFGDEAMSRTQTHEWCKHFKEGQTSVKNNENIGQPSTSKKQRKHPKSSKVIRPNCRLTVREVAEEAKISKSTCHEILTENLGMQCVAAKFVPPLLS